VRMDIDEAFVSTHDASDTLDPVGWTIDIEGDVATYARCLRGFSREQRLMYGLLSYYAEVDNGGHQQFFANPTGIVFPDALAALQEMRLSKFAAIFVEAGRRMGGAPSRSSKERQAQLDRQRPNSASASLTPHAPLLRELAASVP